MKAKTKSEGFEDVQAHAESEKSLDSDDNVVTKWRTEIQVREIFRSDGKEVWEEIK